MWSLCQVESRWMSGKKVSSHVQSSDITMPNNSCELLIHPAAFPSTVSSVLCTSMNLFLSFPFLHFLITSFVSFLLFFVYFLFVFLNHFFISRIPFWQSRQNNSRLTPYKLMNNEYSHIGIKPNTFWPKIVLFRSCYSESSITFVKLHFRPVHTANTSKPGEGRFVVVWFHFLEVRVFYKVFRHPVSLDYFPSIVFSVSCIRFLPLPVSFILFDYIPILYPLFLVFFNSY